MSRAASDTLPATAPTFTSDTSRLTNTTNRGLARRHTHPRKTDTMDDASRLRRKDTTKGPPLRILSLDGGGIRGYSMLIILERLMHKTYVEMHGEAPKGNEIPRPCDHFDLIAGTGTGGLIALMLGRLRLDLDTCKKLYVSMTRRVFETDKTFAGIPYKSTLFKASKLEDAIKECVRAHTVSEREGNDTLANATPMTSDIPGSSPASAGGPHRSLSQSSRYSSGSVSPTGRPISFGSLTFGNANALLYDQRDNRTKTAVTAVYKGTNVTTLLRSYDSRKEPAPDVKCTIWQAGRATSATAMAFKPIQVGQSWYLDEGAGKYNPAPLVLDEAVQNEWPGRDVGVFVSIGTGKRPAGTNNRSHEWWEGFLGGSVGDFADARRRLIAKLEDCENTHQDMVNDRLASRGVSPENYYRMNVEVGVGEFGMNEWARLSEIDTNTRTYLARRDVDAITQGSAAKMAKIHFAKQRHDRSDTRGSDAAHSMPRYSWQNNADQPLPLAQQQPAANSFAVELPGDDMYYQTQGFRPGAQQYNHSPSIADMKYAVVSNDYHHPQQPQPTSPPQNHSQTSPRGSYDRPSPPPLPPKTPIQNQALPYPDAGTPLSATSAMTPQSPPGYGPRTFTNMGRGSLGRQGLPYPDVEGPAPRVNRGNKPTISR
ncbi:uncharacterized protein LTR77_006255 [Saxophila tyrrhenica]|uniref:PNPLA domain-containing protein n=1 Tax=Saxophila tyrrhenica TaxID=1690608 RepID=A0AAV9P7D1_9PEZI|nr:hypothetical protein LTR77_006255 [Saxophila tyrrhenica]